MSPALTWHFPNSTLNLLFSVCLQGPEELTLGKPHEVHTVAACWAWGRGRGAGGPRVPLRGCAERERLSFKPTSPPGAWQLPVHPLLYKTRFGKTGTDRRLCKAGYFTQKASVPAAFLGSRNNTAVAKRLSWERLPPPVSWAATGRARASCSFQPLTRGVQLPPPQALPGF